VGTRTFKQMQGHQNGTTGIDDEFAARGFESIGAWIMGRNMFGPIRGPWPDESWRGWWGDRPGSSTRCTLQLPRGSSDRVSIS
jgi:dihydrofolate reductase